MGTERFSKILKCLFDYKGRGRMLTPEVASWKQMHEEFLNKLVCLNIDLLTFGSVMHGTRCLRLTPHHPYDYKPVRLQMQGMQDEDSNAREFFYFLTF